MGESPLECPKFIPVAMAEAYTLRTEEKKIFAQLPIRTAGLMVKNVIS